MRIVNCNWRHIAIWLKNGLYKVTFMLLLINESRDCWRCVHIEEAMGFALPRVCEECKWSGMGKPGPKFTGEWIEPVKDNFVARKGGRWNGIER